MKTKIIKTVFTVYCLLFAVHSFSQNWQWANSCGGNNYDVGGYICIDNFDNVYISGQVTEPKAFFQTDTLTINGFSDFFLAKYNANGNELWVRQFGGYNATGNFDGIPQIVYDINTNSIYMIGSFIGDCIFGTFHLYAASSTDYQIYLAKFDLNGNCIWAKSAGGTGGDGSSGITIDQNGNILISGYMSNGGSFDTIQIIAGGFLAKYNNNGNCLWAKHITTGGSPNSIKLFNSDIYMSGIVSDTIITIDTITIYKQNTYNGQFLAQFDSDGHIKWAKLIGGPHSTGGFILDMDNNGNCYITGYFEGGYAIFGNDTIHSNTKDFYLVRYDKNGIFKWVRHSNATLSAFGCDVYSDIFDNTYVSGSFSGNATFGSYNITSSSAQDLFVARYDSIGNCIGVMQNSGSEGGAGLTSDAQANVYVIGDFQGIVNFGSTPLVSHGGYDIFVAKSNAISGISNLDKTANNNLLIYANPTTGKCTITVPDDFLNETNLTLSIFDNSGKLIQQKNLEMNENKIKLDLDAEAKGIYTAVLSNGKKSYTGKIVFE